MTGRGAYDPVACFLLNYRQQWTTLKKRISIIRGSLHKSQIFKVYWLIFNLFSFKLRSLHIFGKNFQSTGTISSFFNLKLVTFCVKIFSSMTRPQIFNLHENTPGSPVPIIKATKPTMKFLFGRFGSDPDRSKSPAKHCKWCSLTAIVLESENLDQSLARGRNWPNWEINTQDPSKIILRGNFNTKRKLIHLYARWLLTTIIMQLFISLEMVAVSHIRPSKKKTGWPVPCPAGKISRIPWGISGDFGCWWRESTRKFGL